MSALTMRWERGVKSLYRMVLRYLVLSAWRESYHAFCQRLVCSSHC